VVVQQELLPLVEAARSQVPTLEHVIVVGANQLLPGPGVHAFGNLVRTHPPTPPTHKELGWEDTIALPYSSGTTGMPKGVMLSQKNLVYNACQQLATARITSLDRMLIFLPLYHIYGIMLIG